ncbi:MAG: hypothetical protein B7733_21655 [Myxococcales bacterium FL481]|nr:MAG: hypothetical protein B7733_21655 [Myxococcales bacterium FL481]
MTALLPLEQSLSIEAARPNLVQRTSEQLRCYAQQQAAFFVRHGGRPVSTLGRFMAGRCGLVGTHNHVYHLLMPGDADPATVSAVRRELVHAVQSLPEGWDLAIARADTANLVGFTAVFSRRWLDLEPTPIQPPPDAEYATIRGRFIDEARHGTAYTTARHADALRCRYSSHRRSGGFVLHCPLSRMNPQTEVEAFAMRQSPGPNGPVRTRDRFTLWLTRDPGRTFTIPRLVSDAVDGPIVRSEIVEAINLARAKERRRNVREDATRSQAAAVLWDPKGSPYAHAGLAALQFYDLAGQPGHVPWASMTVEVHETASAGELMDDVLASPFARAMLVSDSNIAISVEPASGLTSTRVLFLAYGRQPLF